SRGEDGSLSLIFSPSAEISVMPAMVQAFARAYPDLRLEVHTALEEQALRAVRCGTLQLAVVPIPNRSQPDVRMEQLAANRRRLVVPVAHPLAKRPRIHLRHIADEPIVLFAPTVSPTLYDAVSAAFQGAGIPLRVRHEASQLHTCLELVAAG